MRRWASRLGRALLGRGSLGRGLLASVLLAGVPLAGRAPCSAQAALPKRNTPDYDGRAQGTRAGDVLLWVPRIVVSPVYLVSEYAVRRPLGFLITQAEHAGVPELLYGLLTFGPDRKAGLIPLAFVDFGFDPSVGLYFFWNDAFAEGHDLRLRAATWGAPWLAASVTSRHDLRRDRRLELQASAVRRPDYQFYGLGPSTRDSSGSRYGATTLEARATFELGLWRESRFAFGAGVRSVDFHTGSYDEDPTLQQQVRAGAFDTPPVFDTGYTLLWNRVQLAIDSRRPRPAPGSGVRLSTQVEQHSNVRASPGLGYLRYGGSLGGFYDLDDHGRVVSLSMTALFVDPLRSGSGAGGAIPFPELASIGGEHSMRGFVAGRLYDRSAMHGTLRYRWPIWVWLDGSILVSAGNVFGAHLRGFRPELLRFSAALGVESVGSPDSSFELLVGAGTETLEQGAQISSVRFAFGTNHGF